MAGDLLDLDIAGMTAKKPGPSRGTAHPRMTLCTLPCDGLTHLGGYDFECHPQASHAVSSMAAFIPSFWIAFVCSACAGVDGNNNLVASDAYANACACDKKSWEFSHWAIDFLICRIIVVAFACTVFVMFHHRNLFRPQTESSRTRGLYR